MTGDSNDLEPGICEGCEDPEICHLVESPCNGFGALWEAGY